VYLLIRDSKCPSKIYNIEQWINGNVVCEAVARVGQMAKSDDEILNGFILGWYKIAKFLLCFINPYLANVENMVSS